MFIIIKKIININIIIKIFLIKELVKNILN